MTDIAIVAAKRSAIGRFSGGLSALTAVELGQQVAQDTLHSVGISAHQVNEIISGQVLTAGCGQNPARQVALGIGMSENSLSLTINQVCGSGLRAIILAAQSIRSGQSEIVLAGGQESMSNAPHTQYLRQPTRYGSAEMHDTIICDGLQDAFDDELMGITAERLADTYQLSRQAQDAFSYRSQQQAKTAIENGYFVEQISDIVIKERKGERIVNTDEHPRFDITLEQLAAMRSAFKADGSVTAGNASGINDGAAYLLLMSTEKAAECELSPLAVIKGAGIAGVDPKIMGIGPVPASHKALQQAGWSVDDIDLIEANEAFAAQALAVNTEMGWDDERVNITGGAIALGHPIGASGARILVTLLHNMQRLNKHKGLATLCVGGGQGVAMCVER